MLRMSTKLVGLEASAAAAVDDVSNAQMPVTSPPTAGGWRRKYLHTVLPANRGRAGDSVAAASYRPPAKLTLPRRQRSVSATGAAEVHGSVAIAIPTSTTAPRNRRRSLARRAAVEDDVDEPLADTFADDDDDDVFGFSLDTPRARPSPADDVADALEFHRLHMSDSMPSTSLLAAAVGAPGRRGSVHSSSPPTASPPGSAPSAVTGSAPKSPPARAVAFTFDVDGSGTDSSSDSGSDSGTDSDSDSDSDSDGGEEAAGDRAADDTAGAPTKLSRGRFRSSASSLTLTPPPSGAIAVSPAAPPTAIVTAVATGVDEPQVPPPPAAPFVPPHRLVQPGEFSLGMHDKFRAKPRADV